MNNKIANVIFNRRLKYQGLVSTFISRIKLKFWDISIGSSIKFYGIPIIKKNEGSIIVIGENCTFRSSIKSNMVGLNRKCIISTYGKDSVIIIGNSCGFSGCVIAASNSIRIGNNVLCGANTLITDFDWHPINPSDRLNRIDNVKSAPITIEDNVWLGINTVVLKGVHIGKNTVIGANSVVVKDIPENVIAAGNPCSVIRTL